MGKIFEGLMGLLFIVTIIVWTLIFGLGGAEILWWIFSGEFFHFVSLAPVPVSTF